MADKVNGKAVQVETSEMQEAEISIRRTHRDGRLVVTKSYRQAQYDDKKGQEPKEVRILKKVMPSHCGIAICRSWCFLGDGMLEMTFQSCTGGDLRQFIDPMKAIDISEDFLWNTFIQVAEALAFLHHGLKRAQGVLRRLPDWTSIIHDDVELANIFLKSQYESGKLPTLILGEFGSAFMDTHRKTGNTLSQNQVMERASEDAKTDVWGLGLGLHSLAHRYDAASNPVSRGDRPPVMSVRAVNGNPKPLDEKKYSKNLNDCVMRCLTRTTGDRIRSDDLVRLLVKEKGFWEEKQKERERQERELQAQAEKRHKKAIDEHNKREQAAKNEQREQQKAQEHAAARKQKAEREKAEVADLRRSDARERIRQEKKDQELRKEELRKAEAQEQELREQEARLTKEREEEAARQRLQEQKMRERREQERLETERIEQDRIIQEKKKRERGEQEQKERERQARDAERESQDRTKKEQADAQKATAPRPKPREKERDQKVDEPDRQKEKRREVKKPERYQSENEEEEDHRRRRHERERSHHDRARDDGDRKHDKHHGHGERKRDDDSERRHRGDKERRHREDGDRRSHRHGEHRHHRHREDKESRR